ncbi:hypothetical protein [Pseudoalteromonas luteoviolacea]|uniref:Uncharacterized protein n=1 Tax=Pseudoalteromonas luteoviolacea H33 TaxID=1365251 RepID=A0A167EKX0_9GAMM|nr:hypothetical protein [Pseudoalteromonas luteoviolacea]KZN50903.1 hypothetical protein N476_14775 [Pseudoalteromonas luteoviolacea H33]KZN74977.1 hypothetical protein N477_20415 [Pseudoalteromonas luteoviolacea H33-S]MBQ4879865.1 hypothetical protein [Pseudoalteromonas luteoviolacea]MBQ4908627.1 hypothetical protein [Pseudoalteromonas luteoviolacea]
MKTTLKALTLVAGTFFAGSAFSADLVCDVYPKGNGNAWGNGTKSCFGFDFSFGSSTSGRFYLKNVTKPIQEVRWSGAARCGTSSTSCGVTVRAYSSTTASALILYKDGTWEQTNTARASYETGH